MELLQLRYFLDCAHLGSIVLTAKKHMVPASAVSSAIRRLEKELEIKLFDRTHNRVILNNNGKQLQTSLELIFSELDQAVNNITCPIDSAPIRLLVLSHRLKITDAIIEYQNKNPSVAFDTNINYDRDISGDYDIIIGPEDPHYDDFDSIELCCCRVYLRANPDHPLYGREITLNQLKDQPFVTMGGNMHDIIVSACQQAGFTPNVIAKVNDISCYIKLLKSSMVIGHYRAPEHSAPNIPYLNVKDFTEYQRILAYYKKDIPNSARNFLQYLKMNPF